LSYFELQKRNQNLKYGYKNELLTIIIIDKNEKLCQFSFRGSEPVHAEDSFKHF